MNHRHQASKRTEEPYILGYSPEGHPIYDPATLPKINNLDCVIIGEHSIAVNGWVFPYHTLSKPVLKWMHTQWLSWSERSDEHKEWLDAIISVFEQRLSGTFQSRI